MFFTDCKTPGEVKSQYRKLAYQYHPDLNPDRVDWATEMMKQVNEAYHQMLKSLDKHTTAGDDGREHTYHYNPIHEQEIIEKMDEVLSHPWAPEVEVQIIGKWLWITGIVKSNREDQAAAKGMDFIWHSKRIAWYWKPYKNYHATYNKDLSLDGLRSKYGGRTLKEEEEQKSSRSSRSSRKALPG